MCKLLFASVNGAKPLLMTRHKHFNWSCCVITFSDGDRWRWYWYLVIMVHLKAYYCSKKKEANYFVEWSELIFGQTEKMILTLDKSTLINLVMGVIFHRVSWFANLAAFCCPIRALGENGAGERIPHPEITQFRRNQCLLKYQHITLN